MFPSIIIIAHLLSTFIRIGVNRRRFVIRLHCRSRSVYSRMQTDLIRQALIIDTANCSLIICSATLFQDFAEN